MKAIKLVDLKKVYGGNHLALDGINMTIPAHSVFGLLGPNGAGKSTIVNILAGKVKRSEGTVEIFEQLVEFDDFEYKRNVGFVFEDPHYLEKLTANEYLKFCGALYEIDSSDIEKRVNELLGFFDLQDRSGSRIETYSKGMKKKVALASAMIHRPKLLVLDEPLEGMDPIVSKKVKRNLKRIADNRSTVLITSHNLNTVEKLCDEVAIINKGKLVFQDQTKNIRNRIRENMDKTAYQSLEKIFIDVTSKDTESDKNLSW